MGTNKRLRALAVAVAAVLAIAAIPTNASLIETGSPGSLAQISRIAQSCPTFSWGLTEDATGYDLVVYRLPDSDETSAVAAGGVDPNGDAAPALRSSVPAGVSAWTPSLDRCLSAESSYAWLVRPIFADSEGQWSEARMFSVDEATAQGDLRQTLEEMVEQILEKREKKLGRPVRQRPVTAVPTVHGPRVAGTPESADAGVPLDGRSALRGQLPPPVPAEITFGLRGIVDNTFALSAGVLGESIAATGVSYGVRGITQSGSGTSAGVMGESSEGVTYGVQGVTTSDSSEARGVLGKTFAENGVAVEGISSHPAGIGVGVRGTATGDGARGLEGQATDPGSGVTYGVRGTTFSSGGRGVFGLASSIDGGRGVAGASVASSGFGGYFENTSGDTAGTALFAAAVSGRDLELGGTGRVKVPATNMKIEGGALEADLECTGCIESEEILDGGVANVDIANDAITTEKIAVDTITEFDIATGAVTTGEILDDTILTADIGDSEVMSIDIATGAVTTDEILDETILTTDIGNGEVKSSDIGDLEVTTLDLADNAVHSTKILDGEVRNADIANGAVRTAEILDNTILSEDIGEGEVKNGDIAADAVILKTQTVGAYVGSIMGGKGLQILGSEESFIGLMDCADDTVLRSVSGIWGCHEGVSTFDAIGSGINTTATMTLGLGSELISAGGKIFFGSGGGIETLSHVPVPVVSEDTLVLPSDVMSLAHTTTGVVAAGMGASLLLKAENDSEVVADVGRFSATMTDVTASLEDSTLEFSASLDGTMTEVMSVDSSGLVTAASFSGDGSALTGIAASTATALAANGANCTAGLSPLGVDAMGVVEGCFDVTTAGELTTHTGDASAHHVQTVDTDTTCLDGSVDCLFAGSATEGGAATTAVALSADPMNCGPGSVAMGVDAMGKAQGCTFFTYTLTVRLPDVSTAGSAWVAAPLGGKVVKITSVVDGAITGSDATLTPKISGVSMTGGSITISEAGSAAGVVDDSMPTAANVLTAGSAIEIATDGGSTGSTAAVITVLVDTAP